MFSGLGLAPLVLIFLAAAGAVWVAGIQLSSSTDALDVRLGLGEALGGAILLAVATNLPEIAIDRSAALAHNLGIAIGNILGGIAIQTVVLVVLDVAMGPRVRAHDAGRVARARARGPARDRRARDLGDGCAAARVASVGRVEPAALLIALTWLVGVWLISRARRGLPWHDTSRALRREARRSRGATPRR